MQKVILSGNEAIARGAYEAGVLRFILEELPRSEEFDKGV